MNLLLILKKRYLLFVILAFFCGLVHTLQQVAQPTSGHILLFCLYPQMSLLFSTLNSD